MERTHSDFVLDEIVQLFLERRSGRSDDGEGGKLMMLARRVLFSGEDSEISRRDSEAGDLVLIHERPEERSRSEGRSVVHDDGCAVG